MYHLIYELSLRTCRQHNALKWEFIRRTAGNNLTGLVMLVCYTIGSKCYTMISWCSRFFMDSSTLTHARLLNGHTICPEKIIPWTGVDKMGKGKKRSRCSKVYSLISSLKTNHPTSSHFTTWSLDLFSSVPFQLYEERTSLQLLRRFEHIDSIAISVLPGIHLHLSEVKQG